MTTGSPRRARRALDLATVGAFAVFLAAPSVDRGVRPDDARDCTRENRTPTPRPAAPASVPEALAWPQAFDSWFRDTCGLRDVLLGARNTLLVAARLQPTPTLDIGDGGWIFFRGDMSFESHRGVWKPPQPVMREWIVRLEERRSRLAARGVRFVFALVPDKETIYPERLPAEWGSLGPSGADLFLRRLAQWTKVEVLDLRPALRAAKERDQPELVDHAYYPRGTHWTPRGACAANATIQEWLRTTFPAITPLDCDALRRVPMAPGNDDSWMKNLYAPWGLLPSWALVPFGHWRVFPGAPPPTAYRSAIAIGRDAALPSIYSVHDSYGGMLHPFLAQSCRRLRSTSRVAVDELVVELERPDVVIMMVAERMISGWPERDHRMPDEHAGERWQGGETVWRLAVDGPPLAEPDAGTFDDRGDALVWTSDERGDHFLIDVPRAPGGRERLAIAYEIDAPHDGLLELWTRVEGSRVGPKSVALPVRLLRGTNTGVVVLEPDPATSRLLVRLGPPGSWTLRELEIRAFVPAHDPLAR